MPRFIALLLLLTGCATDWSSAEPDVVPPGTIELQSNGRDTATHVLDGAALVGRLPVEVDFEAQSMIVRATLPEDAIVEVQIAGLWQVVEFAEQLGRFRTGVVSLPAVQSLAFRSSQPADLFHVELFEAKTPSWDDDPNQVPQGQEPEGEHASHGGPMMDSVSGRWMPSTEAWIAGQEQYVAYEGFDDCSDWEQPGSRLLSNYLVEHFGASHVTIHNCRLIEGTDRWSIHGTGRAIDVMVPMVGGQADNGAGDPIAHFLMENAERIGLQFIIWDRSDWTAAASGDKLEQYTGLYGHFDHLHIELTDAGAAMQTAFFTEGMPVPGADPVVRDGDVVDIAATATGDGYWTVRPDGRVHAHGDADFFGDARDIDLIASIQGMAVTPSGQGYWLVAMDGGVFSFGDAEFFGSMGGEHMNAPVVDMAPTRTGNGYWLVGMDGGIFTFGDAEFFGSAADLGLLRPVVGMAADPNGNGYWLAAADGGVFTFGDIEFPGSMAGEGYEVIDIAADPDGEGVWLTALTGEVFDLGGAPWHGGMQDTDLIAPIFGITPLPSGQGYWQVALDGGVFSHGEAAYHGADTE
jgi:hypothetical protein